MPNRNLNLIQDERRQLLRRRGHDTADRASQHTLHRGVRVERTERLGAVDARDGVEHLNHGVPTAVEGDLPLHGSHYVSAPSREMEILLPAIAARIPIPAPPRFILFGNFRS